MTRDVQKTDMIGAVVSGIVFILGYILTSDLEEGAKMWPQFICFLGAVMSIVQFVVAFRKYKILPEKNDVTPEQKKLNTQKNFRSAAVVAIVALWLFLMDKTGFIVTSSVCTFALMCVPARPHNTKGWVLYAGISVVFCVILWLGFGMLGAKLPRGFLI